MQGTTTLTVSNNGNVDQMLGPVTLQGGTSDVLIVDDSANAASKSLIELKPTTIRTSAQV